MTSSSKRPSVSICIPTFENTEYLDRCLNSIFEQSYRDYEVVLSDDSPGSDVSNLIDSKYSHRPNVRYVKNMEPLGPSHNWNLSLNLATGRYVKILHHDDWFLHKDCLREIMEHVESLKKCNFLFCSSYSQTISGDYRKLKKPKDDYIQKLSKDPKEVVFNNKIGPPSVVLMKKNEIRFDTNLRWFVDLDFYYNLLKSTNGFDYLDRPLITTCRDNAERLTAKVKNDIDTNLKEIYWILHKNRLYSSVKVIKRVRKYFRSNNIDTKAILGCRIPFLYKLLFYTLNW